MRLHRFLPAIVFGLAGLTAHADIFAFNAEGGVSGFSGSGALTGTANGDGSYTITGITGPGVVGLIAPGQFQFNDNLLFPNDPGLLDIDGLSFTDVMANTAYDVNIFYDASVDAYASIVQDADGDLSFLPTTFIISAVTPEPGSIALFGTGLVCMAGFVRRRRV